MNEIDKTNLTDKKKFRSNEISKIENYFNLEINLAEIMLAEIKLNSFETLVSQALIGMEISHEEFITILKEKDKYEKMKENVRNMNEKLEEKIENMRLNCVHLRT